MVTLSMPSYIIYYRHSLRIVKVNIQADTELDVIDHQTMVGGPCRCLNYQETTWNDKQSMIRYYKLWCALVYWMSNAFWKLYSCPVNFVLLLNQQCLFGTAFYYNMSDTIKNCSSSMRLCVGKLCLLKVWHSFLAHFKHYCT